MKYIPESGGGGGGGRMSSVFLARRAVIYSINPKAMEEQAGKMAWGIYLPQGLRAVVDMLIMSGTETHRHVTAERLNELVREANDCSRQKAHNLIKRAADLKIISEERDGRNVYYFLSIDQAHKAQTVIDLLPTIWKVVEIQATHPLNPTAGKDLVSDEVYYNIIAEFDKRAADKKRGAK